MWDSQQQKNLNIIHQHTQMCSHMNTSTPATTESLSFHVIFSPQILVFLFLLVPLTFSYLSDGKQWGGKKKMNKAWTHHERCSAVETFRIQRFRHYTLPSQYFPNYTLKCLVDRKARHSSRGRPQGLWDTPWATVAWYLCAPAPLLLLLSHSC